MPERVVPNIPIVKPTCTLGEFVPIQDADFVGWRGWQGVKIISGDFGSMAHANSNSSNRVLDF